MIPEMIPRSVQFSAEYQEQRSEQIPTSFWRISSLMQQTQCEVENAYRDEKGMGKNGYAEYGMQR